MGATAKMKKQKTARYTASTADKHELYELSVQDTESDVKFMHKTYKKRHGRKAEVLREDFAGTAKLCADWVKRGKSEKTARLKPVMADEIRRRAVP